MDRVGLLLNTNMLRAVLADKKTFEKVDLYVLAARELGVELVVFDIDGVHKRDRHIHGYTPQNEGKYYKQVVVGLPKVVHKRALYGDNVAAKNTVRWLMAQGTRVFNSFCYLGKWNLFNILSQEPMVQEHMPDTCLLTPQAYHKFQSMLHSYGEIFIKPINGTVGIGIVRVHQLNDGRICYETTTRKIVTSLENAWKRVLRNRRSGYIIQQGIPLAKFNNNRYDLRVPLQRGAKGHWVVPGMVAKRAGRTPFLTNLARGGTAYKGAKVLAVSIPGVSGADLYERVEKLAFAVGEAISKHYPYVADLGLDIGLDESGKPWLIEANRRDQRYSFFEAGDYTAFRQLYKNPIAYAKYLLQSDTPAPAISTHLSYAVAKTLRIPQ